MRPIDDVGTTFVNTVIGRGVLNGVVNISFAVFNFTPQDDGQVNIDPAVACRLRMDKICAIQLRDVMNDLVAIIEKAEQSPQVEVKTDGIAAKPHREQIN